MRRFAQFAKSGASALSGFTGRSATFPKVRGSVYVGVGSKATGPTAKPILGLTVSLLCMPADRALPAAIARIDRDQQDGSKRRFVRQKCPQLSEGPRMQNSTLRTPGLDPFAYPCQFLDGDSALGAFSFRNDLLGNYVVGSRKEKRER
jgi:hypothetical protein